MTTNEQRLRPKKGITLQANCDCCNRGIEYTFLPSETYRYIDYEEKDYSGELGIYDIFDPDGNVYGLDSNEEYSDCWIGHFEVAEVQPNDDQ